MAHVVLLGDSIFDNGHYTQGGPDVISQVRTLLPVGWEASLVAVDGSTTENINEQVQRIPDGATHLVLSVGGNDAIMSASRLGVSLFGLAAPSNLDALQSMAEVSDDFAKSYSSAIRACLVRGLPLVVCTIYNGCFPYASYQRLAAVGLTLFNNVILNVAIEHRIPVIDLRVVCSDPQDYANPIEPSSVGGREDCARNRYVAHRDKQIGLQNSDLRVNLPNCASMFKRSTWSLERLSWDISMIAL